MEPTPPISRAIVAVARGEQILVGVRAGRVSPIRLGEAASQIAAGLRDVLAEIASDDRADKALRRALDAWIGDAGEAGKAA